MEMLGDATPVEDDPVKRWVITEGYYPGTSRVMANDLYQRFLTWLRQHPEIVTEKITKTRFGMEMGRRFKRGRSSKGHFYYISRSDEADLGNVVSKLER